jgi:hypothetical protein
MKYFILLLFLSFSIVLVASDVKYPVKEIPDNLLLNANAVYRLNKATFEIEKAERASFNVHKVITIMSDRADDLANFWVGYDNLIRIKSLEAYVYDKNGREIKNYKEKDFTDYSNISGASLYEDSRVKVADLSQNSYPYTVEIIYELQFKYLFSIPDWKGVPSYKVSVQSSEYALIYPKEFKPRYKMLNSNLEPIITQQKDREQMKWDFGQFEAVKSESYSKGISSFSPVLQLSPSKFSFEGYSGDMSTWDGMAKWQNKLNEGLNDLSDKTINEVKNLVADLTDEKAKVKAIYKYMQSKTRYVSIQLGVGGFKPFSAGTVDEVGYGDCKGLSFYTKCLLEAVGINSYYSWIYGGKTNPEVDKDFPYQSFNHAILFVPLAKDTLWLECTDQKIPAGYLGDFTSDRYALVLEPTKANLIRTPRYGAAENTIKMTAKVTIDEKGNANTSMESSFIGIGSGYRNIDYYITQSTSDQEKWLRSYIDMSDFSVNNFEIKQQETEIPQIDLQVDFSLRGAVAKTSDKFYLNPTMFNPIIINLKNEKDRKSAIYFPLNSFFEYEVAYETPEGYSIEKIPTPGELKTTFGSYKIEYEKSEKGLKCKRSFYPSKGTFPADEYEQFKAFYDAIKLLEKQQVVISKI